MSIEDAVARLQAGLDRDEAVARAALGEEHAHESGGELACPGARCAHDVQHNPARVLRQVAKLRAVLAEHADDGSGFCSRCWDGDHYAPMELSFPCPTIRALAGIYTEPTEES
jgi:hypothetical protein